MTPAIALLSVEQLIWELNRKIFMEYACVRSAVPTSRKLIVSLTNEIDALEKQAKDILCEVITLRNSLRPANRPHPEVLALCAAFVSDSDPKLIIPLTHVCRYWRSAITSSPGIWAKIDSRRSRLAQLFLERSGSVPLSVKISVPITSGNDNFLKAVVPHVSKISKFSLTGCASVEDLIDDFPGFFNSPMPKLTTLELEQSRPRTDFFPSTPAPPPLQNVSKLQSLHLTRVAFYSTLYNIPSLVELKLVGYTIPIRKFLEFLGSNFALETVVLDLQLVGASVPIAPEAKAALPRLKCLTLTCDTAADSAGLLSNIALPRGVRITIQGSQSNPCTDLASFLPFPQTPIKRLLAPVTVIKNQASPRWLHIFSPHGQLSFRSQKSSAKINDEFGIFTTGAVREFHVGPLHTGSRGYHLLWALQRLPALEVLVVSGVRLPRGPLSVLAKEPNFVCPSLKTIAFFDCEMTDDVARELEEVLVKRRNSAVARLYRVVIVAQTCALPGPHVIRRLRMCVPCVDVGVGDEIPNLL